MSGVVWKVVGGGDKGGIVVREGKELKSKEAPERLATGSLVKELELAGERLSYELVKGSGPSRGWVSLKLKDKDLVVKAEGALPVLACFYSGGMTSAQGAGQLRHWLLEAEKEGFTDHIILDHIGEEGYADCKDFGDYTSRLKEAIDKNPKFDGRPVIIVAHSHGTVPAWGLAKLLADRVLKLYVLTRRPPNGGLLDETWGVDSAPKVADLDEEVMLKQMIEAWPNDFLFQHKDKSPLPPMVKKIMQVVKRQYSSPCFPCGTADVGTIVGDDPAIPAPILALAAELEAEPKGETASKMQGWRDFTAGSFEAVTVPGVDHMGIMGPKSPAFAIMLKDMKTVI